MKNKEKPTQNEIEKMAKEVYSFLVENDMWYNISIFYNNKKMTSDIKNGTTDGKSYLIEEDVSPGSALGSYNQDHILSMTFEGPLLHAMNGFYSGSEEICEKLSAIFEKYKTWYQQENSFSLTLYPF